MGDARLRAWVTLAHANLPQASVAALLRETGGPEALVEGGASLRAGGRATAEAFAAIPPGAVDATLEWLAAPGHRLLAWDDPDYPRALLDVGDAPPVLFQLGRRELLNRTAVAIVGSRRATPQGIDDACAFARALAAAGVTVISGLAEGIDSAAHRGALDEAGGTLAVVATGLDRVYPATNHALAHALAGRGCLVSEFVPGSPPEAWHFPRRNRLISGLARAVLVVEASLRSGSLITAPAGEQGREVMAIPGSIHAPLSRGCHKLIREGAKLVETAQDVLVELGLAANATRAAADAEAAGDAGEVGGTRVAGAPASQEDARLLAAMGNAPVGFDRLVARTGFAASTIAARMTALEIEGQVRAMPGGLWQRRV